MQQLIVSSKHESLKEIEHFLEQVVVEHIPGDVPLTVAVVDPLSEPRYLDTYVWLAEVLATEHNVRMAVLLICGYVQAQHGCDRPEGVSREVAGLLPVQQEEGSCDEARSVDRLILVRVRPLGCVDHSIKICAHVQDVLHFFGP